jgi:hypothetical protein
MGAEPYFYIVPYQEDIDAALQKLREQEFQAGRYNPAVWSPFFSRGESPGAQHATIDEAREAAEADGTRSILDLDHISDEPEICAASPVPEEELIRYFGTTKPTREMADENDSMLLEEMDRILLCHARGGVAWE